MEDMSEVTITEQATENATRMLRQAMTKAAETLTREECADMLEHKRGGSFEHEVARAFTEDYGDAAADVAKVVAWGFESYASGYKPEDCAVTWIVNPEDPDGSWMPALTCKL